MNIINRWLLSDKYNYILLSISRSKLQLRIDQLSPRVVLQGSIIRKENHPSWHDEKKAGSVEFVFLVEIILDPSRHYIAFRTAITVSIKTQAFGIVSSWTILLLFREITAAMWTNTTTLEVQAPIFRIVAGRRCVLLGKPSAVHLQREGSPHRL